MTIVPQPRIESTRALLGQRHALLAIPLIEELINGRHVEWWRIEEPLSGVDVLVDELPSLLITFYVLGDGLEPQGLTELGSYQSVRRSTLNFETLGGERHYRNDIARQRMGRLISFPPRSQRESSYEFIERNAK
jgi:hypothetical protein